MPPAPKQAYPLCWPAGQLRTPAHLRVAGTFSGTPDKVRREMLHELDRMVLGTRARTHTLNRDGVIISTNVELRLDGEPKAGRSEPIDPGVALYFKRADKPIVIASDKYDKVWKNMRAIHRTLESLRAIERYGSTQLQERAFVGFAALPEHASPDTWRTVLELPINCTLETARLAWKAKTKLYHPDNQAFSDREKFDAVQQAWRDAQLHFTPR